MKIGICRMNAGVISISNREREKALAMWPPGKKSIRGKRLSIHLSLPDSKRYAKGSQAGQAGGTHVGATPRRCGPSTIILSCCDTCRAKVAPICCRLPRTLTPEI